MQEVFISYSRKDKAFVQRLSSALEQKGHQTWVDWHDIEYAEDWWQKIQNGIAGSDNFVSIISPHSVRSKLCFDEVQYADDSNKRIIPVVIQDINDLADQERTHPILKRHNWLFFRPEDDFDSVFDVLLETVGREPEHVRMHTRLLVNAHEWLANDRNNSFLLRGNSLQQARTWLQSAEAKSPEPTALHNEYIAASGQAEITRRRRTWSATLLGLAVVVVLAVIGLQLSQKQDSLDMTEKADQAHKKGEIFNALSYIAEANQIDDPTESVDTLRTIAGAPGPVALFVSDIPVARLALSPDRTRIIVGHVDGSLRLWDATRGVGFYDLALYTTPENEWHAEEVSAIDIGPKGRYAVSAGCAKHGPTKKKKEDSCISSQVFLWEIADDRLVLRHSLVDARDPRVLKGNVYDVEFNLAPRNETMPEVAIAFERADGPLVLTYSFKNNGVQARADEWMRDGSGLSVTAVTFRGDEIVAGYENGSLRYWQGSNNGAQNISGFKERVTDIAMSPARYGRGSRPVLASSADGTARKTLASNNDDPDPYTYSLNSPVNGIAYSPDGLLALAAVEDGRLVLIDTAQGKVETTLRWQPGVGFEDVDFGDLLPDEKASTRSYAISGSADGTVILWDTGRTDLTTYSDSQALLDWLNKHRFLISSE